MKLEINQINHNYILKVVIFSLFLFKGQFKQPNVYKMSVLSFIKRRIPWKIELIIDTGLKLSKEDQRDLVLDELLYDIQSDSLYNVRVSFKTPLKETTMDINLRNEELYSEYIYS